MDSRPIHQSWRVQLAAEGAEAKKSGRADCPCWYPVRSAVRESTSLVSVLEPQSVRTKVLPLRVLVLVPLSLLKGHQLVRYFALAA